MSSSFFFYVQTSLWPLPGLFNQINKSSDVISIVCLHAFKIGKFTLEQITFLVHFLEAPWTSDQNNILLNQVQHMILFHLLKQTIWDSRQPQKVAPSANKMNCDWRLLKSGCFQITFSLIKSLNAFCEPSI